MSGMSSSGSSSSVSLASRLLVGKSASWKHFTIVDAFVSFQDLFILFMTSKTNICLVSSVTVTQFSIFEIRWLYIIFSVADF
jgi:hypothetical protein